MLDFVSLALVGLLGNLLGQGGVPLDPVPLVSWQEAKIFDLPTQPDPAVRELVADYLKGLAARGFNPQQQGVWIQSEWAYLAQHRPDLPASAASLTKVATTLAALERWETEHRFETRISTLGSLEHGVLAGDLIVEGSGDPLFVWEEAIALGNRLNQLEIRKVTGNLIIVGNFYANFQAEPLVAGEILQQGLDSSRWSGAVERQYQSLPPGTARPQVAIAGRVEVGDALPPGAHLRLRHQSLTLTEILKQMNIYSNNAMAEMLAQSVGGAVVVARTAAAAAEVPPEEIQLVNGSGLGVENRLSPRAVAGLWMALERKLAPSPVRVTDLFPVAGRDATGTMRWRQIPAGVALKTGTLAQVSALAGVIPTRERGPIWFAILNQGGNIEQLRSEQDRLLQRLAQHWQVLPPAAGSGKAEMVYLGDPSRNLPERSD